MIVMASHMQEQEVGDGTNFVLVFAGALLELAEELLRMGLSVSEVRDEMFSDPVVFNTKQIFQLCNLRCMTWHGPTSVKEYATLEI